MDIDQASPREVEESDSNSADSLDTTKNVLEDRTLNNSKEPKKCAMMENEAMVGLMSRVCELCHDFYSHQLPNMRYKCR